MEDTESDPEWVSIKEAMEITGLTRTAIEMRRSRGILEWKRIRVQSPLVKRIAVRRSQLPIKQEEQSNT